MIGIQIENGFIDFAKTDFKCPNCEKQYNDRDDKYLDRCQNNKNGCTKIKCECGAIICKSALNRHKKRKIHLSHLLP